MARADRLLRLLQAFRLLPQPVTAARLAEATGVSERSLYRDIASLRDGGALITGEAGVGYTLTEDPSLPSRMFTQLEVEALVLGLAEVRLAGDPALSEAARAAQAKVLATLPDRAQRDALHAVQETYRFDARPPPPPHMALVRQASWDEAEVRITYRDTDGSVTSQSIWPLSVVLVDRSPMLLAWCCLRKEFRHFDVGRIGRAEPTGDSFRPRRVALLRQYHATGRD